MSSTRCLINGVENQMAGGGPPRRKRKVVVLYGMKGTALRERAREVGILNFTSSGYWDDEISNSE